MQFVRRKMQAKASDKAQRAGGGKESLKLPPFLLSLVIVFALATALLWGIFVAYGRLAGNDISLFDPAIDSIETADLYDIVRSAVTTAGVFAGVFAIVYSYRKQRVQEAASTREDDAQLADRYKSAAEQLGHEKESVRFAGIYALSRLADDWAEQRQECIDVLCAYLRLPEPSDPDGRAREAVLRRAVLTQIAAHTTPNARGQGLWSGMRFDLSGASLPRFSFRQCVFKEFILDDARIVGEFEFEQCRVKSRLSLRSTRISDNLRLGVRGKGATIFAWDAHIEPGAKLWLTETPQESTAEDFPRFVFGNGYVADSAELRIEIGSGTKAKQFDFWGTRVAGRLALYGTGQGCQDGAIRLRDVVTEGSGMVGMQVELFEAQGVVKPLPTTLKAHIGTFSVGEWEVVEDD
ncbi:hypothetical protein JOE38_001812 [Clavibacter michiganensis]|uniref:hypothetical protein n=1 Tax=Clavibacter michiganensis TaxID=28447 RepID=UPI00195D6A08|nr:hypothetical protein [Clavibacter michiganensis]MBM7411989.1 hypothetical protein [Clavibacter michiganensis]